MEKSIRWFKQHITFFKLLFVFAVLMIVIAELLSISKTISLERLQEMFDRIPLWQLGIIAIVGLLSVAPMLGYDFTLKKLLKLEYSNFYIFETSWIINTINNIAGFGGLVSIGLRNEFYGKGSKNSKVISSLTKIFVFVLSGLSIYSLLSFIAVEFFDRSAYVKQYWIWLLGAALYFPIVFVLSQRKKEGLLSGLTFKEQLALIGTSFFEWTGMIVTFSLIGYFLKVPVSLADSIPLFIAATVIGIISLIPGGLGSFDVMMILGFSSLGIPREIVVLWLVIYRIAYYLLPFVVGLLLFSRHLFLKLDNRYNEIPRQLAIELFHKVVVVLLYFSGMLMVLLVTVPEVFYTTKWLERFNPFGLHLISEFPSIILGFSLIIMGRGMAARVKRAYYPTIILLVLTAIYAFTTDFSLVTVTYLVVLLLMVIVSKSELYREQLVYSWEWMTIDGIIFGLLALLYVVLGVYSLPAFQRHPHPHRPKFVDFLLFPSEKIWLSGFIAILIVVAFISLFTRYLKGNKKQVSQPLDKEVAQTILQTYGGNIDSELVFLGDKELFLYPEEEPTVFLQLRTYNNKCVVMGNPSGNQADFPAAIEAFVKRCDRLCYLPVFYEVGENTVLTLHEFGYDFIKMGEEALVYLPEFSLAGKKNRGIRSLMNKLAKEGYTFSVLQPPFTADQMATLKDISDSWLDGRKEKGFSLGFFDEEYLQRNPIAVVQDAEGVIVSFANIMPTYTKESATIDLMRHHKELAPSGTMDFLFVHLFEYLNEQGIEYFNLGMAPLSNVGKYRQSFIQERIAALVYEFGSEFYSFQGLRDYKAKFASIWHPRYTLYSRDSWILYVMITLLIIDNAPPKQ